ncbi:TetR/AcrR family transcriptional regulator [Mycobacterium sp.]|jgi:AcrR family transcriptional regulator|uniref:TetR/AcrR family transcriptional regulator n=1 Tax=Mycobacterium sp. TaxID=1785 RepID=UPI002D6DDB2A|nr:TetR/AcrR family transcriptional regulator [Mycobacterium sp.]HZA11696.1 TetR/AcrR family transcriptional regulator [Mycobacterium sp.]
MPRPRTFEEDDVVAAARDAFWSGGYAGTSLDDLTAATGLGKGSLYGAFGDKHALFMRTLGGYCEVALDATRRHLRGPVDGAYQRLADYVRALAALNTADTELRGCLMAKSAAELAGSDTDVREKVSSTLTAIHTELARTVADAQREGTVAPDADADKLASLVLAVLRGMESLHKSFVGDRIVVDAAEQILQLLPRR